MYQSWSAVFHCIQGVKSGKELDHLCSTWISFSTCINLVFQIMAVDLHKDTVFHLIWSLNKITKSCILLIVCACSNCFQVMAEQKGRSWTGKILNLKNGRPYNLQFFDSGLWHQTQKLELNLNLCSFPWMSNGKWVVFLFFSLVSKWK